MAFTPRTLAGIAAASPSFRLGNVPAAVCVPALAVLPGRLDRSVSALPQESLWHPPGCSNSAEHSALRRSSAIPHDFGIGRRVCANNWTALRAGGDSANRRLCDAEAY